MTTADAWAVRSSRISCSAFCLMNVKSKQERLLPAFPRGHLQGFLVLLACRKTSILLTRGWITTLQTLIISFTSTPTTTISGLRGLAAWVFRRLPIKTVQTHTWLDGIT